MTVTGKGRKLILSQVILKYEIVEHNQVNNISAALEVNAKLRPIISNAVAGNIAV